MVVCICKAVADRQIAAAVREGARSVEELGALCGAGTDCGCCCAVLEEYLPSSTPPPEAVHGSWPPSLRRSG